MVEQFTPIQTDTLAALDKERLSPRFTKVVFGHWAHDFDMDQLATYFLAKKAYMTDKTNKITSTPLLNADIACEFTPIPSQADLDDPSVLVIEGIPKGYQERNTLKSGNFDNAAANGQEIPAVEAFAQGFSRSLTGPDKEKISELRSWLKATEQGEAFTGTLKNLNLDNLKQTNTLFEALKYIHRDDIRLIATHPKPLVDDCTQLLEAVFTAGTASLETVLPTETKQRYDQALALKKTHDQQNDRKLEQRVREPGALRFLTTPSRFPPSDPPHLDLAYIDVRGLGVDKGGVAKAAEFAKRSGKDADWVMLIDDETNDQGEIVGTQMIIKPPSKEKSSSKEAALINLEELALRLHHSERLLGKGFTAVTTADYGGHALSLSTPRTGSGIDNEALFEGLQDYLEQKRYTQEEWRSAITSFAHTLGCETFDPDGGFTPSEHGLAKRTAMITLTSEQAGERHIQITEDELPFYEQAARAPTQEDREATHTYNRDLLLAKAEGLESETIRELKERRAQELFTHYLSEKQTSRAVTMLDRLSVGNIERLPLESRLNLLEQLGNDPTTIPSVWDKDNPRFALGQVFDWLPVDSEGYKAAKYRFSTALPAKIDQHLIGSTYDTVVNTKNQIGTERFRRSVLRILGSEAYQVAHQKQSYDHLLHTALKLCTDSAIPEASRQDTADSLAAIYGNDMASHWQTVARSDATTLIVAQKHHPALQRLFSELSLDMNATGDKDAVVVEPNKENVLAHIEDQKKRGMGTPPYLTLSVQIGRDVEDVVRRDGVIRWETDTRGRHIKETAVDIDAKFTHTGDTLDLSQESRESTAITANVVSLVKQLADISPEANIRIFRGGFPTDLAGKLSTKLLRSPELSEAIRKRIVYCDRLRQNNTYIDTPLLDEED